MTRYHVLERRFWDQAQRRLFFDPKDYKGKAIATFKRPLADMLKTITSLTPKELYPRGMVEIRIEISPELVDSQGRIHTRVPVESCRRVKWL